MISRLILSVVFSTQVVYPVVIKVLTENKVIIDITNSRRIICACICWVWNILVILMGDEAEG